MNKYGDTVDIVMGYRDEIGAKISDLEKQTDDLSSLQSKINPLQAQVSDLGRKMSEKRKVVAKKLSPQIEKSLAELGWRKRNSRSTSWRRPSRPHPASTRSSS